MAVDSREPIQGLSAPLKPSTFAMQMQAFLGDVRRKYDEVLPAALANPMVVVAPWAGVIESVSGVQELAGGGAGLNRITLTIDNVAAGANLYTAAADGDTHAGNAGAGTRSTPYPNLAAGLTESADGEDRVHFSKGDVITLTATGANHGTERYELILAREVPQTI